jgi:hypothetical protein
VLNFRASYAGHLECLEKNVHKTFFGVFRALSIECSEAFKRVFIAHFLRCLECHLNDVYRDYKKVFRESSAGCLKRFQKSVQSVFYKMFRLPSGECSYRIINNIQSTKS